ncbi:PadR family transcriptional regulator [Embleya sp. AB8]|uniref:PadR family transcriptional regulator n=1 Tax=Embleya sp. AB8 TaxID=3156304 RepID=UPI003C71E53F
MAARVDGSPQTRLVFEALRNSGEVWRYGYDIVKDTGVAPGTLYPILGRLSDRGLLESRWEEDPPEGRPRRHLYRLSAAGVERARELAAEPAGAGARSAARPRSRVRPRLAEGSV